VTSRRALRTRVGVFVMLSAALGACSMPSTDHANRGGTPSSSAVPRRGAASTRWRAPLPFAPTFVASDARGAVVVGPRGAALVDRGGRLRWHTPIDDAGAEVPALGAGVVVVARRGEPGDGTPARGAVLALARADGTVRWERPLAGAAGPVAVAGGVAYAAGERTLVALDLATGATRWHARLPGTVPWRSTIAVDSATGTVAVVVGAGGRWFLALRDARTGADAGGLDLGALAPPSAPVIAAPGLLVVGNGSTGEVLAADLRAGVIRWVRPLGVAFDPSSPPAVGPERTAVVLDGNGDLWALDAATGALRWHSPLGLALLGARPVVVAGTVAVADFSGGLHLLDLAGGAPLPPLPPGGVAVGLGGQAGGLLVAWRVARPDRLELVDVAAPRPPGGREAAR
jgi:outer membrane protein assembly factor BamB